MARRKRSAGRTLMRFLAVAALLAIGGTYGKTWLEEHPQHNPWAPLDLRDPPGWATATKLASLSGDSQSCLAVLERSLVPHTVLDVTGEGACERDDRLTLSEMPFAPRFPQLTCGVAAGMELWMTNAVQPAAEHLLGSRVARVEHLGTYSCRRLYGSSTGRWSEHATGNAIDVSGFILEDGRRVRLLSDWGGDDAESAFLREVRDGACRSFGTVLSPDYNAAHADHFHLDQGRNPGLGACR